MLAACGVLAGVLLLHLPASAQSATAAELAGQGAALLGEGRFDQALDRFRKALAARPADPALEFNVGLALFRLGRFEESLGPLERALAHRPSESNARFLRGIVYFQLARHVEAATELEAVRHMGQFGERTLYMLTECYRLTGRVESAQGSFLELERRYPDSALHHKLVGTAYEAEGSYTKALKSFQAALSKDPNLPEVAFAIGFVHFKQRDYQEAGIWLQRELAVQPCHARSSYYLGEISALTRDLVDAEEHYLRALSCDESYPAALAGLGAVHAKQQRFDDALATLRKAVELGPDHAEARYNLAQVLLRVGRREEAEVELARVRAIHAAKHETAREAIGDASPER